MDSDKANALELSTLEECPGAARTFVSVGNRYFGNPGDMNENLVDTALDELYGRLREQALAKNPKANKVVGVRMDMAAGPAPGLNTLYINVYGMAVEC